MHHQLGTSSGLVMSFYTTVILELSVRVTPSYHGTVPGRDRDTFTRARQSRHTPRLCRFWHKGHTAIGHRSLATSSRENKL